MEEGDRAISGKVENFINHGSPGVKRKRVEGINRELEAKMLREGEHTRHDAWGWGGEHERLCGHKLWCYRRQEDMG